MNDESEILGDDGMVAQDPDNVSDEGMVAKDPEPERQPDQEDTHGYGGHIKKESILDPIPLIPFKLPYEVEPDFFEFSDPDSPIGGITNYSWMNHNRTRHSIAIKES